MSGPGVGGWAPSKMEVHSGCDGITVCVTTDSGSYIARKYHTSPNVGIQFFDGKTISYTVGYATWDDWDGEGLIHVERCDTANHPLPAELIAVLSSEMTKYV